MPPMKAQTFHSRSPCAVLLAFVSCAQRPIVRPLAFDNAVGRGQWKPDSRPRLLENSAMTASATTTPKPTTRRCGEDVQGAGLRHLRTLRHHSPTGQAFTTPAFKEAIHHAQGQQHGDLDDAARDKGPRAQLSTRVVLPSFTTLSPKSALDACGGIYPHAGFYVATAADAARIAKRPTGRMVGMSIKSLPRIRHRPRQRT